MSSSKKTAQSKADISETVSVNHSKYLSEDKISLYLLILLILIIYIIRSKFLSIPFERDEGAYGYYGKLLLEGKIPYKDFYEQKFPGIFYFFGLMVALFGDTVRGMHGGFIFLNIATVIFIYFASKKLFSSSAAIISAITFGIVSLTPNLSGFTIQSEHGVAFFSSLGFLLYAYADSSKKWYMYLFMGVAFGCAFMVKTSGVFLVVWGGLILIINFFFDKQKKYIDLFKTIGFYSAGVFSVIGTLFLIIYLKGAFQEMLFWTFEIPKNYVSKVPFEEGKKYFGYTKDAILMNYKFLWYHAMLAVGLIFIKSINIKTKLFALTLAFFSSIMIVPGFYFYGHYWIQLIPGLSILAGLSFHCIISLFKSFKVDSPYIKYIYLSIFCMLTYSHLNKLSDYYFHPNYERILRSVYGNNPFPESMEVANWINANSKPEDEIVLIGSEPQVYFYTKKHCPSRHAYFAAIVDNIPQHKEWQREFVKDVEKAKPRYFIFYNHGISLFVQPNTDKYVFDWANKYLTDCYQIVGVVDMIPGTRATYAWREQLNGFKTQAQEQIYIYERKPDAIKN